MIIPYSTILDENYKHPNYSDDSE